MRRVERQTDYYRVFRGRKRILLPQSLEDSSCPRVKTSSTTDTFCEHCLSRHDVHLTSLCLYLYCVYVYDTHIYICVYVCDTHMPQCSHGSQRTTWGSLFSPFHRVGPRDSGLQEPLPTESSHQSTVLFLRCFKQGC